MAYFYPERDSRRAVRNSYPWGAVTWQRNAVTSYRVGICLYGGG